MNMENLMPFAECVVWLVFIFAMIVMRVRKDREAEQARQSQLPETERSAVPLMPEASRRMLGTFALWGLVGFAILVALLCILGIATSS